MLPSPRIVPVILAAGRAPALAMPQALARFGARTALEIAIANCRAARDARRRRLLAPPVVVLGWRAADVLRALLRPGSAASRDVRIVVNRRWRAGQMNSLRAALRHILPGTAVLLYPVDYALITPRILTALAQALAREQRRESRAKRSGRRSACIMVPTHRGRTGHPVLFSAALRPELLAASTARDVVERDPARIIRVPVPKPAIWQDFDTPAEYRRCLRAFGSSQ